MYLDYKQGMENIALGVLISSFQLGISELESSIKISSLMSVRALESLDGDESSKSGIGF